MHNGGIGGFMQIRRKLLSLLSDECYDRVQSVHSDSAVAFAVFMHQLGCGVTPRTPNDLRLVMQRTIDTIVATQVRTLISLTNSKPSPRFALGYHSVMVLVKTWNLSA